MRLRVVVRVRVRVRVSAKVRVRVGSPTARGWSGASSTRGRCVTGRAGRPADCDGESPGVYLRARVRIMGHGKG